MQIAKRVGNDALYGIDDFTHSGGGDEKEKNTETAMSERCELFRPYAKARPPLFLHQTALHGVHLVGGVMPYIPDTPYQEARPHVSHHRIISSPIHTAEIG